MSNLPRHFTIRVYGLLIQDNQLLLSHENIRGKRYTKLPGGGLEFGEGTIQCLEREFMEELNLPIKVRGHHFTTDEFLVSAFNSDYQVMSIYYRVKTEQPELIHPNPNWENSELAKNGGMVVYWAPINENLPNVLHFPMDKKAVSILLSQQ